MQKDYFEFNNASNLQFGIQLKTTAKNIQKW